MFSLANTVKRHRHVLLYGLLGGVLITLLKLTEYRFLVIEHSLEIYGGLVAALFAAIGIWLGLKLTKTKERLVIEEKVVVQERVVVKERVVVQERVIVKEVPVTVAATNGVGPRPLSPAVPFLPDQAKREELAITPRELEILALIARGLSNREIADKLFVSENTVKTHSSRVFEKLGARRRTQAVQLGKEMGLLP